MAKYKNIELTCPSCGGALVELETIEHHRIGKLLACKETMAGSENCPNATGTYDEYTIDEAMEALLDELNISLPEAR